MAVQMFEKWRLPDMPSDAKLALATAMTSETPGPSHEAAIQILKESLRLDEKRNDVQRQLKKLETIVMPRRRDDGPRERKQGHCPTWQCCKRANSKLHERARGLRTAFFSAYEDHIEDKVKITQREEAYKCMRKLASDFGSEPRLGCNANRENLTTVVKDVDVLHFHGHTATHPNIIYQSLVLSDGKTSETSSGVQEFHHTQSSTSPYRPTLGPHKDAFTVRDAFSLDLNLSLASIVACSSGVQNYGTGDEPQGLLSALQYAGCATAIGTLWPLHSEDGRAFTLYFFQAVRRQGDNIASPWNLALSFQKAIEMGRAYAIRLVLKPQIWLSA
ncbi:hypothetical protein FOXG_17688 [Fusarium oxysporum f. sp. lycopersici 4287]|uniref:CHAT domain-containing protein n=2 Tax=Fusarium oxysporum TaxID=5507 RepID=A0A0J9WDL4_FUSO4|nr:uncharacterized protein FOXG_17688 [Fusarium oxysporum f. sp. lycopersici 4287]KNB20765.1 hypothetical protein FOXG_17688 [Fusarium oxysporum f. sp. lycopersici 4287]